ncbi:hypothetical protein SLS55_007622 [Diplodia seriata]|uniref:FAD-binding PCMH-type domain-containing protein n=1 Tax=Diplodia seriata TaxID=420778 RepID=A0ABR3C862_9PEZI
MASFQHGQQQAFVSAGDESQSQSLFWAQQQQSGRPACFVHPQSAADIAAVISISRSTGCPFAVRGGGHSDMRGASNSDGGITVNMAGLSTVEVDDDAGVARVGAGARWGAVYAELEKTNKTVVGGRLTSVGVGGLLLGGGLSHFSGLHGWACDNVRSYELVLANGSVIDVSASAHSDLYRALRGGGNSFGVVTRFDLDTFAQGPLWGGLHVWPLLDSVTRAVTAAFVRFAYNAPSDPHVSLFAGLGYRGGHFAWAAGQYDALGREAPSIFDDFNGDMEQYGAPKVMNTARVAALSDFADELDRSEPAGMRSRFTTATFRADAELLRRLVDVFKQEVATALRSGLGDDELFAPMLGIQPLSRSILEAQKKRGGNVMGLDESDGPLVDDAAAIQGIKAVLEKAVATAKEGGLYHPFKYLNYAAEDQDPLASYGEENVEFLRRVRKAYDADGVFTTLVPGGFKFV